MTIQVVAALIRRDGHLLITQRPQNVHLAGLWEFPGGKVEPNESHEAALVREILEEIAVRIAVLSKFLKVEHHYPTRSVEIHFYNCAILSGEAAPVQVADLRWVRPAELDQYAFPDADQELIRQLRQES